MTKDEHDMAWNAAIEAAVKACEALKRPIDSTDAAEMCRNADLDETADAIERLKRCPATRYT